MVGGIKIIFPCILLNKRQDAIGKNTMKYRQTSCRAIDEGELPVFSLLQWSHPKGWDHCRRLREV